VVPVATAQQLVRGFRATVLVALALGIAASLGGVTGSYYADTPPGAMIVVVALGGFAVAAVVGSLLRRVHRRRRSPSGPSLLPEEAST
jgi:zinc transport system permease protein